MEHPPYMCNDFTCCVPAIDRTIQLIRKTQDLMGSMDDNNSTVEIEVRFGHCGSDGFRAGVTEPAFHAVHNRLNTCRDFIECRDRYREAQAMDRLIPDENGWYTVQVFTHMDRQQQRTIRTETIMPNTGSTHLTGTPSHGVSHICKQVVERVNYRTVVPSRDARIDFRLAVSIEQQVPTAELDLWVTPSEVHIKKRKDYTLCPTGMERPCWRFSLTQRWKGRTLSEAEADYKTNAPVFEIELELIDADYTISADATQLTYSILMKISDILEILDSDLTRPTGYTMEPVYYEKKSMGKK